MRRAHIFDDRNDRNHAQFCAFADACRQGSFSDFFQPAGTYTARLSRSGKSVRVAGPGFYGYFYAPGLGAALAQVPVPVI